MRHAALDMWLHAPTLARSQRVGNRWRWQQQLRSGGLPPAAALGSLGHTKRWHRQWCKHCCSSATVPTIREHRGLSRCSPKPGCAAWCHGHHGGNTAAAGTRRCCGGRQLGGQHCQGTLWDEQHHGVNARLRWQRAYCSWNHHTTGGWCHITFTPAELELSKSCCSDCGCKTDVDRAHASYTQVSRAPRGACNVLLRHL